jgi:type IV secretion system protein VirB4
MMPVSAVWAGPERDAHFRAPPLIIADTYGHTPFRYALHQEDVGHTLIIGPTGSGKTVLLGLMAMQFLRYQGAQVYLFDKGQSLRAVSACAGGHHYIIGERDAPVAFQPLRGIDTDGQERSWAAAWIEGLLVPQDLTLRPADRAEIWRALAALAQAPAPQRTMTGLTHMLQYAHLREALEPYTLAGAHGQLLDADHDAMRIGSWLCFEMEPLFHTPRLVAPVLSYLFHQLERRFTGAPTLVILDEAWLYLDHPLFAAKLAEWLKTLRKANVSVVFATQSLADTAGSSIAAVIHESCFTRIFLPNTRALEEQVLPSLPGRQRSGSTITTPRRATGCSVWSSGRSPWPSWST